MREALRFADYPALSAGVVDVCVGEDDAEPICVALSRREVPFIFFTGLPGHLSKRWATTPVVQKPAARERLLGALQFVLSPETREIIVQSQRGSADIERLSRIEEVIAESDARILRMRRGIAHLTGIGVDTSAADAVLKTMTELLGNLKAHRDMSAHLAAKLAR
jgi:hypothetical protein